MCRKVTTQAEQIAKDKLPTNECCLRGKSDDKLIKTTFAKKKTAKTERTLVGKNGPWWAKTDLGGQKDRGGKE
jgi:hypothetical protein